MIGLNKSGQQHHHPSLAILNLRASSNPPIFSANMATIYKTEEAVRLDGFQAVLKPEKYNYFTLACVIDQDLVDDLEEELSRVLIGLESRARTPSVH